MSTKYTLCKYSPPNICAKNELHVIHFLSEMPLVHSFFKKYLSIYCICAGGSAIGPSVCQIFHSQNFLCNTVVGSGTKGLVLLNKQAVLLNKQAVLLNEQAVLLNKEVVGVTRAWSLNGQSMRSMA
jgi:hypothetical protein